MALADQLKNRTPLYAVVGAGDLVVERLRTTAAAVEHTDPRTVHDQVLTAQSAAQQRLDALVAELRTLPDRAQTVALDALDQAAVVYGELAQRGETLVTRVRGQQSTQRTAQQARATAAQAKGTATTARRQAGSAASTTRRSAERGAATATTSAKKAAKQTTTRGKATSTSARKTARSATRAAADAVGKVGD